MKIEWIDVLKGIGIILVVIGHVYSRDSVEFLYLFHMPLFFFISGYLYKPQADLKVFFIKKFYHLIIPYLVYLFILVILPQVMDVIKKDYSLTKYFIKVALGGRFLLDFGGVFWFMTVLFATQQAFNYLYVSQKIRIVYSSIALSLILAYLNSYFFPDILFPWNLNVVFFAMPILFFGFLYRNVEHRLPEIYITFLTLALFSIGLILESFKDVYYSMDLKYARYGFPVLSLIGSLVLIYLTISISKFFTKIPILVSMLTELGQASMSIMYIHLVFKYLSIEVLGITNMAVVTLVSLLGPLGIHKLFKLTAITKFFFLGEGSGKK